MIDVTDRSYGILVKELEKEFSDTQNRSVISKVENFDADGLAVTKDKILSWMREQLPQYQTDSGKDLSSEEKEYVLSLVRKDLWGYGLIDDLIHEPDISDIKVYGPDRVMIKEKGKRKPTRITFSDNSAYDDFVTKLLERNKVNLGTANAIQTFTDSGQKDAILRITAMSGLLVDGGLPVVAFRKIPKNKYTLSDLESAGMFRHISEGDNRSSRTKVYFSLENLDFNDLVTKMIASKGILFTGKGAAGKTTLMNAMLAEIPHNESVMICQENPELFDFSHPDLFSCHTIMNNGDSKVSYTLGDLTRAALLMDIDRVIVGEVKEGSEAAGLSKASMTGHKCWTSVHGESCRMAIDKMADYISQATGYAPEESLKQLSGFEYVVHLKNFHVDEVVKISGWDKDLRSLIIDQVYPFEEGSRV